MQVRFYGHASIHIKTDDISITTDPWFSKKGAFLSTWFQFPDNTELNLEPVRNSDYIILSHEHQDHFDLEFLKTLSKKTKIIIPKYTDSYLYDMLKENLDNEIIVVNSLARMKLGSTLTFCPVVQSVPIWDDCTLIFKTPECTLVNVNDMKINPIDLGWIKDNFKIDYLFIQFSGANWHPYVFDYTPERKIEIAKHKISQKFYNVKENFLLSKAKYIVPFAGPPCFLDDKEFELNFSEATIFPTQAQFYEYAKKEGFADKTILMLPGDDLPKENIAESNERKANNHIFTHKREYLEAYRGRRTDIIKENLSHIKDSGNSLLEKAKKYFEHLLASTPYFRKKINGKILFETKGTKSEKIIVDFSKDTNWVKLHENEDYLQRYEIESRFLEMIFDGRLTWEQLLLSLRFKTSRVPDIYNEFLIVFLRFADPHSYQAYELFDSQKSHLDTFELEHNGCKYKVQKYCPHAMGNLEKGMIIKGNLVCPNHGWTFSLETGKCINSNSTIKVEKIVDENMAHNETKTKIKPAFSDER